MTAFLDSCEVRVAFDEGCAEVVQLFVRPVIRLRVEVTGLVELLLEDNDSILGAVLFGRDGVQLLA